MEGNGESTEGTERGHRLLRIGAKGGREEVKEAGME